MALNQLLSMRLGVPDPAALGAFYTEMGLTHDGHGGYGGSDGGSQVVVDEHPFRRLLEVRVGADDTATVDAAARRLRDGGLEVHVGDGTISVVDPVSAVTFRVEVADRRAGSTAQPPIPENRPGTTVRRNQRAAAVDQPARPPRRLGHLVIGSPDIAATRRLLVDGLGFRVSDEVPGIISFLRCSTDHHNVALVGAPVPLLQHYSWECDDVDHVGHAASRLLRTDPGRQAWGFGRHYIGSNYYWYLHDSAGSFVEFYSDLDVIDDDDEWETSGRTPVGVGQIANAWGPDVPMEFIVPSDLDSLTAAWAARG